MCVGAKCRAACEEFEIEDWVLGARMWQWREFGSDGKIKAVSGTFLSSQMQETDGGKPILRNNKPYTTACCCYRTVKLWADKNGKESPEIQQAFSVRYYHIKLKKKAFQL